MRVPGGVRAARTAAAAVRARLVAGLPAQDRACREGWFPGLGGGVSAPRPERGTRASGEWLGWRPRAPAPSAGAALGGQAGHGSAPAAAAAAADPAPGPGA